MSHICEGIIEGISASQHTKPPVSDPYREREAHPNPPIVRGRREVLAIRGETDRPNFHGVVFVNESTAESTSADIENPGVVTAPRGEPQAVLAKSNAKNFAVVVDLEREADVERSGFARVIEREPILAILPGINK